MVEAVAILRNNDGPGFEHLWRLTEHARFHDPREPLPGMKRCKHCRRFNPE
jgi:hypothetical protein